MAVPENRADGGDEARPAGSGDEVDLGKGGPSSPRRFDRLVGEAVEAEFETGRREETEAEAKRHLLVRVARVSAGFIVLLLGIAMLVLPGPGILVVCLGLGLLAADIPFAARLLEPVRKRLPADADGSLPRSTIVMMVVVGVGAVAASIAFTVWRMQAG